MAFAPEFSLSIAIITRDMSAPLLRLLDSIRDNSLYRSLSEIVVVDDGSVDGTVSAIQGWKQARDTRGLLTLIEHGRSRGRFQARRTAANAVTADLTLFLDTRLVLPSEFGEELHRQLKDHAALMPALRIDHRQSLLSLYWTRSHEVLFRKTWRDEQDGFELTAENYHQYVTGMGALVCRTSVFLRACEVFAGREVFSDDTALLFEIVKETPIYRDARLFYWWEPRQNLRDFLTHIFWDRGINFADYHVREKWSWISYAFFAGVMALIAWIVLWIGMPMVAAVLGGVGALALMGSAIFFAKTAGEFFRLAPVHALIVLTYGLGALFGVFRLLFRSKTQA